MNIGEDGEKEAKRVSIVMLRLSEGRANSHIFQYLIMKNFKQIAKLEEFYTIITIYILSRFYYHNLLYMLCHISIHRFLQLSVHIIFWKRVSK